MALIPLKGWEIHPMDAQRLRNKGRISKILSLPSTGNRIPLLENHIFKDQSWTINWTRSEPKGVGEDYTWYGEILSPNGGVHAQGRIQNLLPLKMAQWRMEQNQQCSSKELDPSQESTGRLVSTAPINLFPKYRNQDPILIAPKNWRSNWRNGNGRKVAAGENSQYAGNLSISLSSKRRMLLII